MDVYLLANYLALIARKSFEAQDDLLLSWHPKESNFGLPDILPRLLMANLSCVVFGIKYYQLGLGLVGWIWLVQRKSY